MLGDTCGAGGAHSSGTSGLTLDNSRVHVFPYFLCLCVSIDFVNVPGWSILVAPLVPFLEYTWYKLFNNNKCRNNVT